MGGFSPAFTAKSEIFDVWLEGGFNPRKGPKRDIGIEGCRRRLGSCRHPDFQDQTCRCCEINERVQRELAELASQEVIQPWPGDSELSGGRLLGHIPGLDATHWKAEQISPGFHVRGLGWGFGQGVEYILKSLNFHDISLPCAQAARRQIDVLLRRLLGLLQDGMKNNDAVAHGRQIDYPKGASTFPDADCTHARSNRVHRLPVSGIKALLDFAQLVAGTARGC